MNTRFIIVMGVAGCGKTTVGISLTKHLGWDFYDADDFHPPENIAKMINGIRLNDADRHTGLPMLQALIFHHADDPNMLAYIGQIGQDIM
jgi:gluconokinase